jgi:Tfp pilus assembly protein PilN
MLAMIKINLLPTEIRVQAVKKQLILAGYATCVFCVLCLLGFLAWRFHTLRKVGNLLEVANGRLRQYQAIVDKVDALQLTRNRLQAQRDVIQNLLVGRLIYPQFFEDFMVFLPSEVSITNITTTLDSQRMMEVALSCQSLSNFAIADWLTNLKSSSLFSQVVLGAVRSTEQPGGISLKNFTLNFKYLKRET